MAPAPNRNRAETLHRNPTGTLAHLFDWYLTGVFVKKQGWMLSAARASEDKCEEASCKATTYQGPNNKLPFALRVLEPSQDSNIESFTART